MNKALLILLIFYWAIPTSFAQLKTYSFEEAERLSKENPKPIVIFVHTSWCKYCKMMENSTFKNQNVITLLNTNFYFVSLDAEHKAPITFNNYVFKFKPKGQNTGIHELATALATIDNEVIYPTITVLDPDFAILFQKHSMQYTKELVSLLEKLR